MRLTLQSLARLRLRNQQLVGATCRSPLEVVTRLGAVQSQDYGAAKWALGLRAPALREADVDGAFDRGEIARTHVLRPTWHFVPPTDIRWMLALTAPRIRTAARSGFRALGLDDAVLSRSRKAIERALSGEGLLTRVELAERIRGAGLRIEGQRPHFLTLDAELCGLVCSGPRRGKQFTYALLEQRIAPVPPPGRDEALATLARRYFDSHGPATLHDFAWWSGLAMADVRRAVEILAGRLERIEANGTPYFMVPARVPPARRKPVAHLLPCFDEYLVAYRERSVATGGDPSRVDIGGGGLLTNRLAVDGVVDGTWRRAPGRTKHTLEVRPSGRLPPAVRDAVARAVDAFETFHGR